jgi:hypothetical protein
MTRVTASLPSELVESARPDVVLLAELDLCLRLRRGEPGRTWDRNVPVSTPF